AAPGARHRTFDERVENVRPPAIDVEADAAERTVGQPVPLEPHPRLAGVGRFPDPAARAAAVHAARRAAALIGRRVENPVVRRVHHEIVRAGVLVNFEDLLPVPAAVGRLVDPALAAGAPQTSGGGDAHDVVAARIDHDAVAA